MAERGTIIELRAVEKQYRTLDKRMIVALSPTTMTIKDREFISIVGPSGCGKTTLLNMVSGLIPPSGGEILFRGSRQSGPSSELGLVFQRPVLLPWRRVIDNVLLPVEVMGLQPRAKYLDRARELLAMIGLGGFENAYPRELSGGMQQRAAIARTLVYDTSVLLMDEPFAALDAMTREDLNLELLRIWRESRKTILFVTHGIQEAVFLATRVVVLTAGPARMADNFEVALPHPRTLEMKTHEAFGEYVRRLYRLLGME